MRPRTGDGGHVTPAFVATVGMTMVLLAVVANLLVNRYADGVLRAAVEEGVRQGVATASDAACALRTDAVIEAGLGPLRARVDPPVCVVGTTGAEARVSGAFSGWLPIVPTHHTTAVATSASLAADE